MKLKASDVLAIKIRGGQQVIDWKQTKANLEKFYMSMQGEWRDSEIAMSLAHVDEEIADFKKQVRKFRYGK